jgi:hypothetical protein
MVGIIVRKIVVLRVQLSRTPGSPDVLLAPLIPVAPRSENGHECKKKSGNKSMARIRNEHAAENYRGNDVVDEFHRA